MSEIRYAVTIQELPPPSGWTPIWMVEDIERDCNLRRRHYFGQSKPAAECYAEMLVESLASPLDDKIINMWLILVEEEYSAPLTRVLMPGERPMDYPLFPGEIAGFIAQELRELGVPADDDDDDDGDDFDVEVTPPLELYDYLNEEYSSTLCSTNDPGRMRLRVKRPSPQALLVNTDLYPRFLLRCVLRTRDDAYEIESWVGDNSDVACRFHGRSESRDGVRVSYFFWVQRDVTRFLTWAASKFPGLVITREPR